MSHSHHRFSGALVAASAAALAAFSSPAPAHPGHGLDDPHSHQAQASTAPPVRPAAPARVAKPEAAPLPADVLAQVNGQNITRANLLATLDTLGGQPLLRQMVTAVVVEQEAKRLGVNVTDIEVNRQLAEAKQRIVTQAMMQGNPGTFAEIAEREGVSEGLLRWSLRQRLLAQKAYAKHAQASTPLPSLEGQIKASHILIATRPEGPGAPPTTDEEAKKKITGLLADIRAGKTTFEEAAKQNSSDPGSAAQGGSLGWFGKNMMVPEFSETAFGLAKAGDISEPVKTQFGYHIIRLDKKGTEATAADRAVQRDIEIARSAQNQQGMTAWITGLMQKATIRTNPNARIAPAR